MIKQSELNPDNIGKDSRGMFGDGVGLAGTRRVLNPNRGPGDWRKYLPCDGPAGGCQGPIESLMQAGDRGSRFFGINYKAGSTWDLLTESFAGPHDWLSNQVGMYGQFGNGIYRTGLKNIFYDSMSWGLIPVAAPFSAAALVGTTPGVQNTMLINSNSRW